MLKNLIHSGHEKKLVVKKIGKMGRHSAHRFWRKKKGKPRRYQGEEKKRIAQLKTHKYLSELTSHLAKGGGGSGVGIQRGRKNPDS